MASKMKYTKIHLDWQNKRIDFMIDLYGKEFFKGKKILELGSCNGHIGNYFLEKLGADVTSVEGRMDNIYFIKREFPLLKTEQFDLDTDQWPFEHYDIIINFGLFYHLEKHHVAHLTNCINNCDLMFFETVIFDSDQPELFIRNEFGNDQSLSEVSGTPSTSYVENIFKMNNCKFVKYSESRLNSKTDMTDHCYDWEDKNTKEFNWWNRRFWTVEKN